jgi:hypothetical protein
MGQKDARIDAYIAKAQPFAKPIVTCIRKAAVTWIAEGKLRSRTALFVPQSQHRVHARRAQRGDEPGSQRDET